MVQLAWSLESPDPGRVGPFITSPQSDPLGPVLTGTPNTGPDPGSTYVNPHIDVGWPTWRSSLEATVIDPPCKEFR